MVWGKEVIRGKRTNLGLGDNSRSSGVPWEQSEDRALSWKDTGIVVEETEKHLPSFINPGSNRYNGRISVSWIWWKLEDDLVEHSRSYYVCIWNVPHGLLYLTLWSSEGIAILEYSGNLRNWNLPRGNEYDILSIYLSWLPSFCLSLCFQTTIKWRNSSFCTLLPRDSGFHNFTVWSTHGMKHLEPWTRRNAPSLRPFSWAPSKW